MTFKTNGMWEKAKWTHLFCQYWECRLLHLTNVEFLCNKLATFFLFFFCEASWLTDTAAPSWLTAGHKPSGNEASLRNPLLNFNSFLTLIIMMYLSCPRHPSQLVDSLPLYTLHAFLLAGESWIVFLNLGNFQEGWTPTPRIPHSVHLKAANGWEGHWSPRQPPHT